MRWSQCTVVVGTATFGILADMNCSHGHLGGGVLHGDAVGAEVGVGDAPLEPTRARVVEVVDQDLLGERQRPTEPLAADRQTLVEGRVDTFDEVEWGGCCDSHQRTPCVVVGGGSVDAARMLPFPAASGERWIRAAIQVIIQV